MSSFTDDIRSRGMTPGSRTLELRVVPAGARLGRVLHVSPSEPVPVAKRRRLADRETMAIETLHVRASLVPGLSAADLDSRDWGRYLDRDGDGQITRREIMPGPLASGDPHLRRPGAAAPATQERCQAAARPKLMRAPDFSTCD